MDRLETSPFLNELTGTVFIHQLDAMRALEDVCTESAYSGTPKTTKPIAALCPLKTLASVDRL
ncbi:MAG: hypothetical protein AAFY10_08305 [Pseudomonadota bacterium]